VPRRRSPQVEDAEIVAEVIASPGVRVHGPPVAVAVERHAELAASPPLASWGAVLERLPPEVGELVIAGRQALEAARSIASALEAFGVGRPNPPRRRRR